MAVIYLTDQGATLTKTDGRMVIRRDKKILLDIPAFKVSQVVIFGNAHLTTPAMNFCLKEGIDVCFLSRWGKYRGRLQPELCKDASLRQRQYSLSQDPQFCLKVARAIVRGKIRNAVAFCRRQRRREKESGERLLAMEEILPQVERAQSLESLRGYEGTAAALYYGLFRGFLKEDWGFQGRFYHPSSDPLNALLSLGYTLLYNHAYATVNVVGLDPYQGFLHQVHHGHAALASDLMEEFRSILVDSVVLWTANKGLVRPQDFQREGNEFRLNDEGLKRFLSAYDQRLQREIVYPPSGERTSYLRCLELQARHLAQILRGKAQEYRPFEVGGTGS